MKVRFNGGGGESKNPNLSKNHMEHPIKVYFHKRVYQSVFK